MLPRNVQRSVTCLPAELTLHSIPRYSPPQTVLLKLITVLSTGAQLIIQQVQHQSLRSLRNHKPRLVNPLHSHHSKMGSATFTAVLFGLICLLAVSCQAKAPSQRSAPGSITLRTTARVQQLQTTVGNEKQITAAAAAVVKARESHVAAKKAAELLAIKAQKPGAKKNVKNKAKQAANKVQRMANKLTQAENKLARFQSQKPLAKLLKKKVTVAGKRLPLTCYCTKSPPGESKCYFFTVGNYCSVRYCAPSYMCIGQARAGGTTCLIRMVKTRVVPFDKNTCRRERVDSYMYVPYAAYNGAR